MIIGDSSALVALAIMDGLELLEKIFDTIYVPQAVYDEVTMSHKPESIRLRKFLINKVVTIKLEIDKIGLGRGELEAIARYKHKKADFLLIDDRRAKNFAKLNGLNVIGSLGVMMLAKESKYITSIRDNLEKLKASKLFISEALIERVLCEVGE
jgi:predicted nucleic acid-binding protein